MFRDVPISCPFLSEVKVGVRAAWVGMVFLLLAETGLYGPREGGIDTVRGWEGVSMPYDASHAQP